MTDHSTRLLPRAAIVSDGCSEEPAVLGIGTRSHVAGRTQMRQMPKPAESLPVGVSDESLEWTVPDIASP